MQCYIGRQDLKFHIEWLEVFNKILAASSEVQAAVLLGSFAKGRPDRLSDLDVVVWAKRSDIQRLVIELFAVKIFEVVHSWQKQISEEHVFLKRIYGNFISAEVHIIATESEFRIRNPFITLKGSEKFIDSKREEGPSPEHKDFYPLPAGIDGLGWELFDMLKWWQRGEYDLVKSHLVKVSELIKLSSPS